MTIDGPESLKTQHAAILRYRWQLLWLSIALIVGGLVAVFVVLLTVSNPVWVVLCIIPLLASLRVFRAYDKTHARLNDIYTNMRMLVKENDQRASDI